MADNGRSASASGSPEEMGFMGNYPSGQRGHFTGLDRSASFRVNSESRMFGSGPCSNRANIASTPGSSTQLSQFLALEPLTLGEHKYNGSGELRRILGSSFGNAADGNSLGAAHQTKLLPAAAAEEIKHIKASLVDDSLMSRGFSKHVDGLINNVNKYQEVSSSKKYQRNESLLKDRANSNLSKMGTQLQRNTPESASQKSQDKAKNVVLNKRVRTSVEIRGEGRSNELIRQSISVAKERDSLKEGCSGSDMFEEKIRKLPAGREGWDKKMKKKRSVGSVSLRSGDDDVDVKRAAHLKLSSESSMQLCETQGFRSGSLDGTNGNGISKFDNPSFPSCSSARGATKNEPEKGSVPREAMAGLNKERIISKGINKFSLQDGNHAVNLGSVTKGKSSRSPRIGPVAAGSTIPNISRSSGMLDGWEQHPNVNKLQAVSAVNNRKRPLPGGGSASSPITQWGGQRPHKISRTRRANLISPVSHNDDLQPSSEGGSPSDFGTRMTSSATSGSLLSRGSPNGLQQQRVKLENVSSPARLSESEDSGIGENKMKEQAVGSCDGEEGSPNVGSTLLLTKKNKVFVREVGDGVRRQGRTGRGSQVSKATIAPIREKQDNQASLKPGRNMKPGSDKNGRSGRPPVKKQSDQKLTRLGQISNGTSPDFHGDIDDDHGELLALAEAARSASYLACSNPFWKKMERMLGRLSMADISYIGHQLKHSEELHQSLSQMFCTWDNDLGDVLHEKTSLLQNLLSGESERSLITDVVSKGSSRSGDLIDGFQDNSTLYGRTDGKGRSKDVPPLYQRVLSALIVDDDTEEFDEACGEREVSFRYAGVNSPSNAQLHVDIERRDRDDMEFEYDHSSLHAYRHCATDKSSCNGSYILDRGAGNNSPSCNSELFQGDNSIDSDEEYEQLNLEDKLLLELHSIGIYPDSVPDLAEGEDEVINQEIFGLRRELNQLVGNKKVQLGKTCKAVHQTKEVEGRHLEQIAMDRLTEVTYKKNLVPRGGSASKSSSKVSKPLALAFVKRALSRCHRFESTGESCFADPAVREVLLAPPPPTDDVEQMQSDVVTDDCRSEVRMSGSYPTYSGDQAFAKNGPVSSRGKKKEMLLDDVSGSAAARASLISGNSFLGGAKGKRSERERDNSVVKAGRPSVSNCKGERKTKSKPKQKAAELTSGNGFFASPVHPTGPRETVMANSDSKRKVGLTSPGSNILHPLKESNEALDFANLPIPDLDSIEDLGVGDSQDLGSWLSFDEDGLQDMDLMGLEVPMDDLSQLNMF